ncbi:hypothetical protein HID58_021316 [Brassica napus]|uniref:Uncharacterized protein n=3 Tax=Brassica TaxID=3705 RepID=A0ABQ8CW25_BRANA|nr:hypothetical protein HID58_021316 [Brassica napus]
MRSVIHALLRTCSSFQLDSHWSCFHFTRSFPALSHSPRRLCQENKVSISLIAGFMGEGKGSTLVFVLVIALCLVAFGFSIAAERRRSIGKSIQDPITNATYCVYSSDVATGYGVGAFLFLLSSESLLMGVTKCMCFGRPLSPGSDRAWSIIYFISSWMTFLVAEACLIAGATKNAYHTKYLSAQAFSCESLRKGIFIAGAVFTVATMILNVYYYFHFTKSVSSPPTHKANRSGSNIGMAGGYA